MEDLFGEGAAPALYLLFNHRLTKAQEEDALRTLGVARIEEPPEEIKGLWAGVPPELPEIEGFLAPVRQWLFEAARPGDYVLIQGDFGACFLMVSFALDLCLVPVYATTRREAVEEPNGDGSVRMIHRFAHQRFRAYGG